MQLVDFLKSAAQGYGTEKRILLLHGPVGSSKSTIARLLKKGAGELQPNGCRAVLYLSMAATPSRRLPADEAEQFVECPMHEEPLLLIPREARPDVLDSHQRKIAGRQQNPPVR